MAWEPLHKAHSIERVRVIVQFAEPLSVKSVLKIAAPIAQTYSDLGFDTVDRTDTELPGVPFKLEELPVGHLDPTAGYVLRRLDDRNSVVEELGLRQRVFGYVSTAYDRWDTLVARLSEFLFVQLEQASETVDISHIKLEYWDTFFAQPDGAARNVSELIRNIDPNIPSVTIESNHQWHSHIGWFEGDDNNRVLVNRHIDIVDKRSENDEPRRAATIYTLTEQRCGPDFLESRDIVSVLNALHQISIRVFSDALTDDYLMKVGVDQDAGKKKRD